MAKLTDLPPEIHLEILKYADSEDHFRLGDVMPTWTSLLQVESLSHLRYNANTLSLPNPPNTDIIIKEDIGTSSPSQRPDSTEKASPVMTLRYHKIFDDILKFKEKRVILCKNQKCYDLEYPYHPPPASVPIYLASKLLALDPVFMVESSEGGAEWRPCGKIEVHFLDWWGSNIEKSVYERSELSRLSLERNDVGVVSFVRALMRHMDNAKEWGPMKFWSDWTYPHLEDGKIIIALLASV
ncbi:hypothetical protein AA313_de0208782 [Arthrobotrys entomopaga]|nr:hypothetical protein AA313_de0208782 [Arthrobotrys entomopaga]